jgi:hypothetical protein
MDGTLRAKVVDAPALQVAVHLIRWLEDAPLFVRLALLFLAVVGLVCALPARPVHHVGNRALLATPAPYMTCGIGQTFNAAADKCVPQKPAPLPCVQSAGGCMATIASLPTPPPQPVTAQPAYQQPADPFAGIMGITRDH